LSERFGVVSGEEALSWRMLPDQVHLYFPQLLEQAMADDFAAYAADE
jgi:hypothetical protein